MKKRLFFLALVICNSYFAFSQTVTYTFTDNNNPNPHCCPLWNDNWKSSHGSPGYSSHPNDPYPNEPPYDFLHLKTSFDNLNGLNKSEGVFHEYSFSKNKRYRIEVVLRQVSGNPQIEIYAASSIIASCDWSKCGEAVPPNVSKKELIARKSAACSGSAYTCTVSMPSETPSDYYIPNDDYHSIWVTSYCPGSSSSFIISSIKVIDYGIDKDTEPPTVPGNLQVTSIESTKISVKWNPSTDNIGVTGYEVYCNNSLVGTTTSTQYTLINLLQCTNYKIDVRAFDAAGNFSGKVTINAKTPMATHIQLQTTINLSNQPNKEYYAEAKNSVTLKPGFKVKANDNQEYFHARILSDCGRGGISNFQFEEDPFPIEEEIVFEPIFESIIPVSSSEIRIFPNPTTGILNIETGNLIVGSLEIFDITGKRLLTLKPQNSTSNIDFSTFTPGVYFIKIVTPDNIFMRKLIKM